VGDQCLLSGSFTEVKSISVSTWMGDHQGRPDVVNLGPFIGVDFNLRPIVHILVIAVTRTLDEYTQAYINLTSALLFKHVANNTTLYAPYLN